MGVMDMLQALWGNNPPQQPVTPAPKLNDYPSSDDAAFARQSGFGYGRPTEPYVQQKVARVLGTEVPVLRGVKPNLVADTFFNPQSAIGMQGSPTDISDKTSKNVDLTNPKNSMVKAALGDELTQGALTANRIPIAYLGYDPSHMVADTASGRDVTVAGIYNPTKDSVYHNIGHPGTSVHEAMHRGFAHLRNASPEAAELLRQLPSEEYLVRHLMHTDAGNVERHMKGDISDKQRATAENLFESFPSFQTKLDRIQALAQQLINKRHPMGPN